MKISTKGMYGFRALVDLFSVWKQYRQMEVLRHLDSGRIKFLLYGGTLPGGGKSYFLRSHWLTPWKVG